MILTIIQSASGAQYDTSTTKPSSLLSMQSDTQLQGFGHGILKFNKNLGDDSSCNDITPKPETKIVERKNSLLKIDEKPGYFFIVLGQLNATSYQYLQIGLQRNNDLGGQGQVTNPSYFIDLKKQGRPLMAGLYQEYPNLAVVLESDKDTSTFPEDNYKNYLDGTSKSVTYLPDRLGPGKYDFQAILFQSDTPVWINHDVCAISLHWQFSVDEKGIITTNQPKSEKGKLSDVTKEFPPLQQNKKGVNIGNIECRHGLQLIAKARDGSSACVKIQSLAKLMERNFFGNKLKINNFNAELAYQLIDRDIISGNIFGQKPAKCEGPGCHYIFTSDLKLSIQPPDKDSKLIVSLPRTLMDSKANESDSDYLILVGPKEVDYVDIASTNSRILVIDVPRGTQEIEIFGEGYYNEKLPQLENKK